MSVEYYYYWTTNCWMEYENIQSHNNLHEIKLLVLRYCLHLPRRHNKLYHEFIVDSVICFVWLSKYIQKATTCPQINYVTLFSRATVTGSKFINLLDHNLIFFILGLTGITGTTNGITITLDTIVPSPYDIQIYLVTETDYRKRALQVRA